MLGRVFDTLGWYNAAGFYGVGAGDKAQIGTSSITRVCIGAPVSTRGYGLYALRRLARATTRSGRQNQCMSGKWEMARWTQRLIGNETSE